MIDTIKQAKEIAKKWNVIKTDKERLKFLKENKGAIIVVLDNDLTAVKINPICFEDEVAELLYDIDESMKSFDDYHGCTDAVVELFEFAGIEAEQC